MHIAYSVHVGPIHSLVLKCSIVMLRLLTPRDEYGTRVMSSISDEHTFNVSHYHAQYSGLQDSGTTHLNVLASDGQAVAVTS